MRAVKSNYMTEKGGNNGVGGGAGGNAENGKKAGKERGRNVGVDVQVDVETSRVEVGEKTAEENVLVFIDAGSEWIGEGKRE